MQSKAAPRRESRAWPRTQVIKRCDLAGRVAGYRQRQFVGGDAAAVIADADQADAAFLQVDVDPVRAGVERVPDQFLDHRSRSFDDFAGGDMVEQGAGQLLDAHQANDTDRRPVPWRLTAKSESEREAGRQRDGSNVGRQVSTE